MGKQAATSRADVALSAKVEVEIEAEVEWVVVNGTRENAAVARVCVALYAVAKAILSVSAGAVVGLGESRLAIAR
ncbi:hypothetical protein ACRALDRAFT_1065563 [Sodiomyces alcalophilus JCM 7366]|uniref:uncharacterized protein n=1 Tax=Sodiomyces alcalophilus JCM 7366 TaxID=591952 RepID=UPI0039B53BDB